MTHDNANIVKHSPAYNKQSNGASRWINVGICVINGAICELASHTAPFISHTSLFPALIHISALTRPPSIPYAVSRLTKKITASSYPLILILPLTITFSSYNTFL